MYQHNQWLGLLFIVVGFVGLFFAVGDLLFRVMLGLLALSIINYGLRLRGMPPLQLLVPMMFSKWWF